MKIEGNKITAKEGYVLQRLFDNLIVGKEIILGFTYFINGKELSRPLYEIPEHYIEIPEIEEEEEVLPVDSDNLKDLLLTALNRETQNKIISGFVWRDMKVWLSVENQMNYKNTYDLAIQTNGSILPITFKFGDVETPIYYQFNDIDDLSDFYLKMSKYIADTLLEGWNKKDSINWDNY